METQVNYDFKVLYAIGIVLVICGHYAVPAFTLGNLYPNDTFHIPLLIFFCTPFSIGGRIYYQCRSVVSCRIVLRADG